MKMRKRNAAFFFFFFFWQPYIFNGPWERLERNLFLLLVAVLLTCEFKLCRFFLIAYQVLAKATSQKKQKKNNNNNKKQTNKQK